MIDGSSLIFLNRGQLYKFNKVHDVGNFPKDVNLSKLANPKLVNFVKLEISPILTSFLEASVNKYNKDGGN